MKPCSNNRELIAGLAWDALEPRQERQLRAHLETCEGCRRYLEEVSNITAKLAATEIRSDIQTSEPFHQKVVGALRTEASNSVVAKIRSALSNAVRRVCRADFFFLLPSVEEGDGARSRSFPLIRSKLALSVFGASVIAMAALVLFLRRPDGLLPAPIAPEAAPKAHQKVELDPTVSNYQMVANQSLEKLDELLTRQASRNPSPAPIYTASALARTNMLD